MSEGLLDHDVSIIVTCKGRLEQLKRSIPTMMLQDTDLDYNVIVVDYRCPDGTFEWVKKQNAPGLGAVRVLDDLPHFNLSHARNIGSVWASSHVYSFVDADVSIAPRWIRESAQPVRNGKFMATRPDWSRAGCGICSVMAVAFHTVNGYGEDLKGWGWEDQDLFRRVGKRYPVGAYPANLLSIQKHGADKRLEFYEDKRLRRGIPESNFSNEYRAKHRNGMPNEGGYGRARVEDFNLSSCVERK